MDIPAWLESKLSAMIFTTVKPDHINKDITYYVASEHLTTIGCETDPRLEPFLKDKRIQHISPKFVVTPETIENSYNFYLCFNADCAFPPMYLVPADSFEDAYEKFLEETDACLVKESEIADYDEDDLQFDCNGRPMDTSALQVIELIPYLMMFK